MTYYHLYQYHDDDHDMFIQEEEVYLDLAELGGVKLNDIKPKYQESWLPEESGTDYFSIQPFTESITSPWYLVAYSSHHNIPPEFNYLSDNHLNECEINHLHIIWQQHQYIIIQMTKQGYPAYEILKHIPLNHPSWSQDAKNYFQKNQYYNVYQALPIITTYNIELAQHSRMLIRQYIQEIKKYDCHNPSLNSLKP